MGLSAGHPWPSGGVRRRVGHPARHAAPGGGQGHGLLDALGRVDAVPCLQERAVGFAAVGARRLRGGVGRRAGAHGGPSFVVRGAGTDRPRAFPRPSSIDHGAPNSGSNEPVHAAGGLRCKAAHKMRGDHAQTLSYVRPYTHHRAQGWPRRGAGHAGRVAGKLRRDAPPVARRRSRRRVAAVLGSVRHAARDVCRNVS